MANITQLAERLNLTRQGLYKIAKSSGLKLAELDEETAEELIRAYQDNKSKNNNYIAKHLNISVTKLKRLIDRYGIEYGSFKNADEIIERIRTSSQQEQQEKRERQEQEQALKVLYSTQRQLITALLNNHKAWISSERKLNKDRYRNSRETLKEHMAYLSMQHEQISKELEEVQEGIRQTHQGNLKAYKDTLTELYDQHRQEPKTKKKRSTSA